MPTTPARSEAATAVLSFAGATAVVSDALIPASSSPDGAARRARVEALRQCTLLLADVRAKGAA